MHIKRLTTVFHTVRPGDTLNLPKLNNRIDNPTTHNCKIVSCTKGSKDTGYQLQYGLIDKNFAHVHFYLDDEEQACYRYMVDDITLLWKGEHNGTLVMGGCPAHVRLLPGVPTVEIQTFQDEEITLRVGDRLTSTDNATGSALVIGDPYTETYGLIDEKTGRIIVGLCSYPNSLIGNINIDWHITRDGCSYLIYR